MNRLWLWLPLASLAGAIWFGFAVFADDAVDEGREALNSTWTEYPWYDAEADALRPIPVQPPPPPPPPTGTIIKPQPPAPSNAAPMSSQTTSFLAGLLQVLPWLLVMALLIVAIVLIIRWRFSLQSPAKARASRRRSRQAEIERIAELPFEVQPESDLLAAARREYNSGNYGRAIVYLYSWQLMELDDSHHIRLARGKTNRQYLRELRPRADLRGLLEPTMIAFEDFFFGDHELSRRRFEGCWEQVDQFQRLLNGSDPSTGGPR